MESTTVSLRDFLAASQGAEEELISNAVHRATAGRSNYARRHETDGKKELRGSFNWCEFVPPHERQNHYNAGWLGCKVWLTNNLDKYLEYDYRAMVKILAFVASRSIYLSYYEISDGLDYKSIHSNDFIAQKVSFTSLLVELEDGETEEYLQSWTAEQENRMAELKISLLQELTQKEKAIITAFQQYQNYNDTAKQCRCSKRDIIQTKNRVTSLITAYC